jgi:glutamate-1-semialdehyde 2,1-aminomutase
MGTKKLNMKDIISNTKELNWNGIIDQEEVTANQLNENLNNETVNYKAAERTIDASQDWEFPKRFTFKWYDFILHKNVFSPIHFKWSSVYVDHLPLNENKSLLDMWCWCGVIWITSFLKYHLDKVVCADINKDAVKNTEENISKHWLHNKVKVVQSDVFSNIDENEKFDVIFWNAPYFDWEFDESNILYRSMYDKNYEHIKKFILEWQKHLNKWWKIMIWFSSDKFPLEHARKLINEIWFDLEIFYQEIDSLWYKQEILNIIKKK